MLAVSEDCALASDGSAPQFEEAAGGDERQSGARDSESSKPDLEIQI